MSRIGSKPVAIPSGVQVDIQEDGVVIKGPKGAMTIPVHRKIPVEKKENELVVTRVHETKETKALHGLYRSLYANAIKGVENLWEKKLEIVGTGFNVKQQGEGIVLKVGFSHLVEFPKVEGITLKVQGANKISVSGIDKQLVGEVAYKIKKIKKPDPYKGKGIRYEGEDVRTRPGKKAKA